MNDDGMRLRVRAMLKYMNIKETPQPNKGRIHINKQELIEEVKRNTGKVVFDLTGYQRFKEEETTANKFPDVPQQVRARFRPVRPGEGPPGTFMREGEPLPPSYPVEEPREPRRESSRSSDDAHFQEGRDHRRSGTGTFGDDRGTGYNRSGDDWPQERRGSYNDRAAEARGGDPRAESRGGYSDEWRGNHGDEHRNSHRDQGKRGGYGDHEGRGFNDGPDRRHSYNDAYDRRSSYSESHDRRRNQPDERRGSYRDWERRSSFERRASSRDHDPRGDRDRYRDEFPGGDRVGDRADGRVDDHRRFDDRDRDHKPRGSIQRERRDSYYNGDRRNGGHPGFRHNHDSDYGRGGRDREGRMSDVRHQDNRHSDRDVRRDDFAEAPRSSGGRYPDYHQGDRAGHRPRHTPGGGGGSVAAAAAAAGGGAAAAGGAVEPPIPGPREYNQKKRASDSVLFMPRKVSSSNSSTEMKEFATIKEDPDPFPPPEDDDRLGGGKKRDFDDYQKQQPNRGYNIEPAYSKRRSV